MSLDTGDLKKSPDFGSTLSSETGRQNDLSAILKILRFKAYFKIHPMDMFIVCVAVQLTI